MQIISCDWGTSTLRLALADMRTGELIAEVSSGKGIAGVYSEWVKSGWNEAERLPFYLRILRSEIARLASRTGRSLAGTPVVLSGMASSALGMMELPYTELPASVKGETIGRKMLEPGADLEHPILLVSGLRTDTDVLRGEETQVIGCLEGVDGDRLLVLPGTHSKHIDVTRGMITGFRTYLTGELFHLLTNHGILAHSVAENGEALNSNTLRHFEQGVSDSLDDSLLHTLFTVRINILFTKLAKEENYFYLSGLLIGSELKGIKPGSVPVTVVAGRKLASLYSAAFSKLGLSGIPCSDAANATLRGHLKLIRL